jgi:branched-chain amino acid transport system substrate-binding protein
VSENQQGNGGRSDSLLSAKSVSRRDFLKLAGVAGATIGLGAGLGGVVAACGSSAATATTSGAAATAAPPTTTATTTAPVTTTVASAPEAGREILIGDIIPQTGFLASFGEGEKWSVDLANSALNKGIVLGDGKTHPVKVILQDSQSDENRASQVTSDLILNSKVDIVVSSATPATVLPVMVQAETLETPGLGNFCPAEAFLAAMDKDSSKTFNWIFGHFWTFKSCAQVFDHAISQVPNNKVMGLMAPNNADGMAWAGALPKPMEALGYKMVVPDLYTLGTEDFTKFISQFKTAGVEIITGAVTIDAFTVFYSQAQQQSYNPPIICTGLTLLTADDANALKAPGLMSLWPWSKEYVWKDEITGMSNAELCADWEQKTGKEYGMPVGCHSKLGWAVNALKRATDPTDKKSIADALRTTKTDLITGHIDFTEPVDPNGNHLHPNVYHSANSVVQIVPGTGKWPYDFACVAVYNAPEVTPAKAIQMAYKK